MTLPASGAIAMSQVNTELGRGATTGISLGEAAVRNLAGRPSGAISMNDLHGKSSIWRGIITVGVDNVGTAETMWNGYNVGSTEWIAPAFGAMSDRASPVGTVMNFAWRYWGKLNLRHCRSSQEQTN